MTASASPDKPAGGDPPPYHGPALALLAVSAWTALLLQLGLSLHQAQVAGRGLLHGASMFLAYFTVLTNLFVALAATLPLLLPRTRLGRWLAGTPVRGCATTAILLVGLGYHLLLRDRWNPQGLQWLADLLLHYAVPLATAGYWLRVQPRTRPGRAAPLMWCLYPLAYLAYALLRGALGGFYPYYFIDVGQLGYRAVLLNAAALLVVFLVAGSVVRLLPGRLGRRRPRHDA